MKSIVFGLSDNSILADQETKKNKTITAVSAHTFKLFTIIFVTPIRGYQSIKTLKNLAFKVANSSAVNDNIFFNWSEILPTYSLPKANLLVTFTRDLSKEKRFKNNIVVCNCLSQWKEKRKKKLKVNYS